MKIIIGHSNTDLDCIGSMVLAKYLYPEFQPVRSGLLHPSARKVQNLYRHHINFLHPKDLKGEHIDGMVIVDTRTRKRVDEFFRYIGNNGFPVDIWDHHPAEESGFPGAKLFESPCGANTSQLGAEIMRRGIPVGEEDATIALAGIYADTGNFTHENVTKDDFEVASFLLSSGADLKLVKKFLKPLSGAYQVTLFHEILNRLEYRTIHGHSVGVCYWEIEDDETEGLGLVIERVFELENQDAVFGIFHFPKKKKTLLIGRNQKPNIDLHGLMREFGGGGHAKAASANVKGQDGKEVFTKFELLLESHLADAITARELMTFPVKTVSQKASLIEASLQLEEQGHTGLPVVDEAGLPVGFISLRDIMKGRKADQMHAPVKGFMSKKLVSARPEATIREIERLLFDNNVGHLPVLRDGELIGILTRTDYLNFSRSGLREKESA